MNDHCCWQPDGGINTKYIIPNYNTLDHTRPLAIFHVQKDRKFKTIYQTSDASEKSFLSAERSTYSFGILFLAVSNVEENEYLITLNRDSLISAMVVAPRRVFGTILSLRDDIYPNMSEIIVTSAKTDKEKCLASDDRSGQLNTLSVFSLHKFFLILTQKMQLISTAYKLPHVISIFPRVGLQQLRDFLTVPKAPPVSWRNKGSLMDSFGGQQIRSKAHPQYKLQLLTRKKPSAVFQTAHY